MRYNCTMLVNQFGYLKDERITDATCEGAVGKSKANHLKYKGLKK